MGNRKEAIEALITKARMMPVGQFSDAVVAAFEAGEAFGEKTGAVKERARVLKAVGLAVAEADAREGVPAPSNGAGIHPVPLKVPLTEVVRATFRQHLGTKIVDAEEVFSTVHDLNRHTEMDIEQIRSILKVMARRGELDRISRGRYRTTSKMAAED